MTYQINLSKSSEKSLEKLEKNIRERIIDFLYVKARTNPHLYKEPLYGNKKGLWKFRVGDYRIICEIFNERLVILVIEIGHRREVYK